MQVMPSGANLTLSQSLLFGSVASHFFSVLTSQKSNRLPSMNTIAFPSGEMSSIARGVNGDIEHAVSFCRTFNGHLF